MTGPIKFPKSCGGPTFIFAISPRSWSLKPPSQIEDETYNLESAEHFCPILNISQPCPHLCHGAIYPDTQTRLEHSVQLHSSRLRLHGQHGNSSHPSLLRSSGSLYIYPDSQQFLSIAA